MATRVLPFACTIPPETLSTAPVTIPLALDGWTIERLDLEVPAGTSGLTGFQIYNNGVAFIPYGAGEWIIWDDVRESYYLSDLPNAGGWALLGYNDGVYPHTVTIRAHVSTAVSAPQPSAPAPLVIVSTPDPSVVPVILG